MSDQPNVSPIVPSPDQGASVATPQGSDEQPRVLAEPDKLLRITAMVRELLEETRQAPPDERGRLRLREIYDRSLEELKEALPEELSEELQSLAPPIEGVPTESEIRVAQAQLVGWLEGLFHGIQAAVWAQQMQARSQLEELRRRGLPPGMQPGMLQQQRPEQDRRQEPESGQYL
jgi:Bacterial proteasome activator